MPYPKHIQQSIDLIRKLNKPDQVYNLGFSGGKDSIVLLELANLAGVKFKATYSLTTIDPPGHTAWIRKHYPEVVIVKPETTYFKLIEEKGLPTRQRRFCCEHLKERYGIGKRNLIGVRKAESKKRSVYEPEECDSRAFMKGAKKVYPILEWTDKQIWAFIRLHKLPYPRFYDPPYNFKRLGCIGCPIATWNQVKEFKYFPGYVKATINAIRKNMQNKPNNGLAANFQNAHEAFLWWISETSIAEWKANKSCELFKRDYKEELEIFFKIKL